MRNLVFILAAISFVKGNIPVHSTLNPVDFKGTG
jgi:hypothetical protein